MRALMECYLSDYHEEQRAQPGSTTQNHPCRKPRADLAERMVAMIQTSGLPQSDQDDAIQAVRGSLGVWGGR